MSIKHISDREGLNRALSRIDEIIDAEPGTEGYKELEELSALVEEYEDKNCHI